MGLDMFTTVYRKTEDGSYEKLCLYDEFKNTIDIYPHRNHALMQLLGGYNRSCYDFEPLDYSRGYPSFIPKDERITDESAATHYDYLELVAWSNTKRAVITDYDDEDGHKYKNYIMQQYMWELTHLLNAYGVYYPKPGDVIVVIEYSY